MLRCPSCTAELDDASRYCSACGQPTGPAVAATLALPVSTTPPPRDTPANPAQQNGRFLPGTILARRYRLVALLGRGGMGEVYRADDTRLGHPVALKFLPDAVARDAATLERFYAEVRIGRQVSHPNVIRLYDLVEIEEHHCLVMEYVDGEDLSSLLARIGRLPPDKAVDVARDLCAGLGAAHDKGVIHRDLKPANVMIDGKGRARIADFGIAALAGDIETQAFAGTPAYMAPELLDGQPASVRSDLYALGLVLYEVCLGKPLFEPRSLSELKAMQQRTGPLSLTSTVRDIPPAMERVVLRCLERDPGLRPASAHEAMAALPGGDPLQAAMAAGETPSPAMVAAAGQVGDLPVRQAWAWLLAAVAGLALLVAITPRSSAIGLLRPTQSPELLSAQAQAIVAKLGYSASPRDRDAMYLYHDDVLDWMREQDTTPDWTRLPHLSPGPLRFYYRQSPAEMASWRTLIQPMGPSEVGHVLPNDPPLTTPGMVDAVVDMQGRLIALRTVPAAPPAPVPVATDWTPLFAAAGLDPARFTPARPRMTPMVASDIRAAWTGTYADQPDVELHVEAAAWAGQPVWFEVQPPWWKPPATEFPAVWSIGVWMVVIVSVFLWALIAMLVRRNLRLGRGDRRGATSLALFLLCTSIVAGLLRANHVALVFEEAGLVANVLAQTVFYAAITWLFYMALEPLARRHWPHLLVGWSRLLAGRVRDPLVGRDLLVGAFAGICLAAILHLAVVVPAWLGLPSPAPRTLTASPLSGFRHLLYFMGWSLYPAVCLGIGTLLGLHLFRLLARSFWAALALLAVFLYFVFSIFTSIGELLSPPLALFTSLYLLVALRGGMLAAVACLYVFLVLDVTPITHDLSAWYADRTLATAAWLLGLLGYAFHAALGGKPALGSGWIEHDS